MMQAVTIILFAALVLGFLVLFLAPGRWWPRRPPRDDRSHHDDDPPPPPSYPRNLN